MKSTMTTFQTVSDLHLYLRTLVSTPIVIPSVGTENPTGPEVVCDLDSSFVGTSRMTV